MKCIQYQSGEIERLPNDDAYEIVKAGVAHYIPKQKWKAYTKDFRQEYAALAAQANKIKNNIQPKKPKKKRIPKAERHRYSRFEFARKAG